MIDIIEKEKVKHAWVCLFRHQFMLRCCCKDILSIIIRKNNTFFFLNWEYESIISRMTVVIFLFPVTARMDL